MPALPLGMPKIVPLGLMCRPAGKLFWEMLKISGATPPLTATGWLYFSPFVPPGSDVVRIFGAGFTVMFTVATPLLLTVAVAVSVTCSSFVRVAGAAYVTEVGVTFVSVPQALPVHDVPVSGPSVHFTPLDEVTFLLRLNTAAVKSTVCPWSIA